MSTRARRPADHIGKPDRRAVRKPPQTADRKTAARSAPSLPVVAVDAGLAGLRVGVLDLVVGHVEFRLAVDLVRSFLAFVVRVRGADLSQDVSRLEALRVDIVHKRLPTGGTLIATALELALGGL